MLWLILAWFFELILGLDDRCAHSERCPMLYGGAPLTECQGYQECDHAVEG
jgi:hypothetical protein